ncbi:MAG: bacteriohopanetetrol glucosamine biosynthesis glycosyltransferase HpnI [Nitrospirota bacterium]|jgi:ceramide glucosyltransferase
MLLATVLLFLLVGAGTAYNLFALFAVAAFFRETEEEPLTGETPAVSILKPLKGMDPEGRENLLSFCAQDYPFYEVLMGFTDPDDEAVPLAQDIAWGGCPGRVVLSPEGSAANRKMANLAGLLDAARCPLIAVSDGDMRVDPLYLRRVVAEYEEEEGTGMVTSLYKITRPRSVGAALESLTIGLDFLPSVLVARRVEGVTFGLGASMLLSRGTLEDIGGFAPLQDYLADDYRIGNLIARRGLKVKLSRYVLEDVVGPMKVSEHVSHQVRWTRTYRASRPGGYAAYGITHVLPFAFFLLAFSGPTPLALGALGLAFSVRIALALAVERTVVRSARWLLWLPLLPLKDVLGFGLWAHSFLGNTVSWRGRTYTLLKGGRIRETPKT